MLFIIIDAHEKIHVGVTDVEGAYLHADMVIFTILKMTGVDADIMCKVDTKYKDFITIENRKKVLYLQLIKALCGCIRSALLWYELISSTLQGMGFELNPYNICITNKMIDRKQCTMVWYVDDNKVSHIYHQIVTSVIKAIEK